MAFASGTQFVVPEWFGAKADGRSDDSTAIQKAYNAARATGRYCLGSIQDSQAFYEPKDAFFLVGCSVADSSTCNLLCPSTAQVLQRSRFSTLKLCFLQATPCCIWWARTAWGAPLP